MTILVAIILLGVLIFVHELGHFLVAKRSGVGVLKFSLGFGPKLFGVKRGETEYLISALPLGGYVKMIGEDPGDHSAEATDPRRSFSRKSVGTRASIILAGPLANLLLPILIFWGVFTFDGQPYLLPVIGTPEAGSPAAVAGLLPGDRVVAVDGQKIEAWDEALAAVRASSGRALTFTMRRDGRTFDVRLEPRPLKIQDVFGQEIEVWDVGLQEPLISTRIGPLEPGDIAQKAGIKSGDQIVALNGVPVSDWEQMRKGIRSSPGKPLRLTVEREGQRFDIVVTPRSIKQRTAKGEEEIGQIGIGPAPDSYYRRLNPVSALAAGAQKTGEFSVLIVQGFVKLVQAKISPKTIGGPILIIQTAGEVVQRGAVPILTFTALISINLAILNLLPIPVLDGGHLLFTLIEWLRGKPVSLRKREIAQQVGMVLIIGLMIFAFYNDLFRFLGRP